MIIDLRTLLLCYDLKLLYFHGIKDVVDNTRVWLKVILENAKIRVR
jgi:hypothetical protein